MSRTNPCDWTLPDTAASVAIRTGSGVTLKDYRQTPTPMRRAHLSERFDYIFRRGKPCGQAMCR